LSTDDLLAAVREKFKENEDLPNTTHPDDWAKIAGKKGERVVYVKSLVGQMSAPQRDVEKVSILASICKRAMSTETAPTGAGCSGAVGRRPRTGGSWDGAS